MGFRFRKTIGIIPGVRLNLSKGGISASVGGKGATVNVGTKGVTGSVGLPGTGLSYRKSLTPTGLELARKTRWGKWWLLAIVVIAALALFYARRELPKMMAPARPAPTHAAPRTAPVAAAAAATATVSAQTANCRAAPGRDGKVAAKLAQGDVVTVRERQSAWTHVASGAADCWVSNRTIRLSDK